MKKAEMSKLFTEGKKLYTKTFKIVYLPSDGEGEVIISAPIKIFPKAAGADGRNRVKRLVREAVRGLSFVKNKNICIIYNSKEVKTLAELKSELEKIKI